MSVPFGFVFKPFEQRFWEKVNKIPDGCWEWVGSLCGRDGRGKIYVNRTKGRVYVHRLSYEMHFGEIPSDVEVCHTCDNPKCVNPDHLFLGSHSENMKDAYRKGRKSNHGEKNPKAKITEEIVREIRRRYLSDGGVALAKEFGLERTAPWRIYHRKQWKNVK